MHIASTNIEKFVENLLQINLKIILLNDLIEF